MSNHGLGTLIERHFEQTRAFFSLPMKRKMDIMIDSHHRCACLTTVPETGSLQTYVDMEAMRLSIPDALINQHVCACFKGADH